MLILTALAWSYLVYQNMMADQANQKRQMQSISQLVADAISTNIQQRLALIQGLAQQSGLMTLVTDADSAGLSGEQDRLTRLVPDVLRIRLLPAGYNEPDTSESPNMGYASLLLLRAAEKSDAAMPAELHQFGTP
ncbi:MAG: hypothetical protein KUF80_18835, partial [Candidatus Thiodiazotropha sp. (ex Codakia orbicularis)]|nr:hypothetical protein [Candidatus Thiodiazotropha sp. (ex Codakia orbicularis)]